MPYPTPSKHILGDAPLISRDKVSTACRLPPGAARYRLVPPVPHGRVAGRAMRHAQLIFQVLSTPLKSSMMFIPPTYPYLYPFDPR